MNIPLGVAVTNFVAETGFPTIAHHHDFYWERDRFAVNAVGDFLSMAFPPDLPSIQHVTINSFAQEELSHRCGVSSILVPNVLDFEDEPPEPDEYALSLRGEIGLTDDDIMFLQPTRVVPRKGIEHSIALVAQLKDPRCKLVISHASGDEGHEYCEALIEMAEHQNVDLRFIDQRIDEERGTDENDQRIYTLGDAYAAADFITYPSIYEGFGNALLEGFYYRKPILVNRYSIFIADIEPREFQVVTMDGYLTRETVRHVRKVIDDDEYRAQMVEKNCERWSLTSQAWTICKNASRRGHRAARDEPASHCWQSWGLLNEQDRVKFTLVREVGNDCLVLGLIPEHCPILARGFKGAKQDEMLTACQAAIRERSRPVDFSGMGDGQWPPFDVNVPA